MPTGSYYARFSRAHGVTPWEMASHLSHSSCSGASRRGKLPSSLFTRPTMAICAYGNGVGDLTDILVQATGIESLQAASFQPLADVLARNAAGVVRFSRAWCSSCFESDIATFEAHFDRLIWASPVVTTCPTHRTALSERCPSCDSPQHYLSSSTSLAHCSHCGSSLISHERSRVLVSTPPIYQHSVVELVGHMSENTEWRAVPHALSEIVSGIKPYLPHDHWMHQCQSLKYRGRTSLPTALRFITELCIPLHIALGDPSIATSLAPLFSVPDPQPPRGRNCYPPGLREQSRVALEKIIASRGPFPSQRRIAGEIGVSVGCLLHWWPDHMKRIAKLKANHNARSLARNKLRAEHIAATIIATSPSRGIKSIAKAVAEQTGCTIRTGRQIAANTISKAAHKSPQTAPAPSR